MCAYCHHVILEFKFSSNAISLTGGNFGPVLALFGHCIYSILSDITEAPSQWHLENHLFQLSHASFVHNNRDRQLFKKQPVPIIPAACLFSRDNDTVITGCYKKL